MYKKITSLIIIFILTYSLISQTKAADEIEIKQISLGDAMSLASINNTSIKLYIDKIKVAEKKYNEALKNAQAIVGKYWSDSEERINNAKIEYLEPIQRKAELNELKWQKENYDNDLRLSITKLYFQIIFTEKKIIYQSEVISRAKNEVAVKKKQVELGTATDYDLLDLEIAVDEDETSLISLQRNYDKLVMDMNIKLGLDMKQNLSFIDQAIKETDYSVYDITQLAKDVVSKSHSVLKLEENKMINDKEYDITTGYAIGETPDNVQTLADTSRDLEYKIRDEKVSVEYKVRSDYNNLLNLKDETEIKKLDYDKSIKLLTIAESKYKLGLITNLVYQTSIGDRDSAELSYNQALLEYYLAVEEFKAYVCQP